MMSLFISLAMTARQKKALSLEVRLRLFEAIPDQARRGGGPSYIISVLAGSRGAAA
jgi:hypothetical protein